MRLGDWFVPPYAMELRRMGHPADFRREDRFLRFQGLLLGDCLSHPTRWNCVGWGTRLLYC